MSINGIDGRIFPPIIPGGPRARDAESSRGSRTGEAHGSLTPAPTAPTARAARGPETVPAEAPAGTDPALWNVLSPDERAFFARAKAMGGVTYGPGTRARSAGVATGGRLDVKV
jgi:hypothetical protein